MRSECLCIHSGDSCKIKNLETVMFRGFEMVGAEGVEPSTFWSRTKRATRLRYAPNGVEMGVRIAK